MVLIPYYPVRDEALKQIIRLKLGKIQRRLLENHKIKLTYDDAFLEAVAAAAPKSKAARAMSTTSSPTRCFPISRARSWAAWRRARR